MQPYQIPEYDEKVKKKLQELLSAAHTLLMQARDLADENGLKFTLAAQEKMVEVQRLLKEAMGLADEYFLTLSLDLLDELYYRQRYFPKGYRGGLPAYGEGPSGTGLMSPDFPGQEFSIWCGIRELDYETQNHGCWMSSSEFGDC